MTTRLRASNKDLFLELKSLLAEESTHHPGHNCVPKKVNLFLRKARKHLSFFKTTALSCPESEEDNIKTELSSYLSALQTPDTKTHLSGGGSVRPTSQD